MDMNTSSHPRDKLSITKKEYEVILTRFFETIPFQHTCHVDHKIEQQVQSQCLEHGFDPAKTMKVAKWGAEAAQWFFPHHPPELQTKIALFTAYFFSVDDFIPDILDDARQFRFSLMAGKQEQQAPLLRSFAHLLSTFDEHYEPFCADKIYTGSVDFVAAAVLERESVGKMNTLKVSTKFPLYFRVMTGIAEPFAWFLFHRPKFPRESLLLFAQAVPDLVDFIVYVNDLLSFYKESIVSDERDNFASQLALAHDEDISIILSGFAEKIKLCIANIRHVLTAEPTLLEDVEEFIRGYIGFHVVQSRYRLRELDIPILTGPPRSM